MAQRTLKLDKYAKDARAWRAWADHNYAASIHLFQSHNPMLIFGAATLGHHALEMYLKSALIVEGFTVFDPSKIKYLDSSLTLHKTECIWGHDSVAPRKSVGSETV